jgi:ERCC4-type nuclease
MFIRVDNREHDLIRMLKHFYGISPLYKSIQIEVENLPIGDVIIEKEQNSCDVIIERKSIRDLAASIKDGRYEEQSYRLNGLPQHNHNILYLIEGDIEKFNSFNGNVSKTTIYSAVVSMNFFKGFSVLRTMNIEETAIMILNMAHKVNKNYKEGKQLFYKNKITEGTLDSTSNDDVLSMNVEEETNTEQSVKDYCSVIKKVKKDNVTVENIGEIMLCQIPGVSSVTAIAIMKKFNTMTDLIAEMQEDENCLDEINYTTDKGQTRKINKTAISNIKKYLIC